MSSLRKDLFYVYGAHAISGVLGLALVPLGVHLMGKTGYGLFSIYAVVYSYTTLMESGLTKNLVRLLASNAAIDVRVKHIRTAIGLYSVISFILLLSLPFLTLFCSAGNLPNSRREPGSGEVDRWVCHR